MYRESIHIKDRLISRSELIAKLPSANNRVPSSFIQHPSGVSSFVAVNEPLVLSDGLQVKQKPQAVAGIKVEILLNLVKSIIGFAGLMKPLRVCNMSVR